MKVIGLCEDLQVRRLVTVAAEAVNKVTLLCRSAYAATAAAERRRAALGLALVVLEQEEIVGTNLNFGTQQGLIRRRTAPVRQTVRRLLDNVIICANRLVVVANRRGVIQHKVNKSLGTDGIVRKTIDHQEIC